MEGGNDNSGKGAHARKLEIPKYGFRNTGNADPDLISSSNGVL